MIKVIKDKTYRYVSVFNTNTGDYIRLSNCDVAEYPHLIDIGIMGHCEHGKSGLCSKAGVQCYQDGLHSTNKNMSFDDYKRIIDESKEHTFQVALGGCGDPDMHENFEEILKYTVKNDIIPNFTTSGLGMTPDKAKLCAKYCGAVAVSMYSRLQDLVPEVAYKRISDKKRYNNENEIPVFFTLGGNNPNCFWDEDRCCYIINGESYGYDELHHIPFGIEDNYCYYRIFNEKRNLKNFVEQHNYTMNAIKTLIDAGVKTNIHFVISNSTIDEAIIRLKYNGFPHGINAVIFLLHKPVGLGSEEEVLQFDDPRVREFFELATSNNFNYKIGFDSCSVPGIINLGQEIDFSSIDSCEGARFSMYISSDMLAYPCSFDNQEKIYAVNLNKYSIFEAWNSERFNLFRHILKNSCPSCDKRHLCSGGCPLKKQIVLCNNQ